MYAMQTSLTGGKQVQFKVNVPQNSYISGLPQGFTSNKDNEFIYDYFGAIRCWVNYQFNFFPLGLISLIPYVL